MAYPSDRVYAESHEWHKVDGDTLTMGLTTFAIGQLTDITFVQMEAAGTEFGANDAIGEVESVKATSDVYCACAGEIIEVNAAVEADPSLVNTDPYGSGWLVKIRVSDPSGLDGCMNADSYGEQYPE